MFSPNLTEETFLIVVAYMRADESYTKEEVEDEQETDVLLIEKPSLLPTCETLNSLFRFTLITSNEEMLHIEIKAYRPLK